MTTVRYHVTVHALDRFEQRWPDEVGDDDEEMARVMQREVEDAISAGRTGRNFPRRMHGSIPSRYTGGTSCAWTEDFSRGYVISDGGSNVHIVTAVQGDGIA